MAQFVGIRAWNTGLSYKDFTPELERAFQQENYERSRNFMRGASALGCLLAAVQIVRFVATQPLQFLIIPLLGLVLYASVLGLTYVRDFWRWWQPCLATGMLCGISLIQVGAAHNILIEPGYADLIARVSWFSASTMMLMVGIAPIRLNFRWAAPVLLGLTLNSACICYFFYQAPLRLILDRFSLGVFIETAVLLYLSYTHEQLHRDGFLARAQLAEKEAEERGRRQHTESMLRVLSHAIGGIVHDLGTPLTVVQSGVELLEMVIARGDGGTETLNTLIASVHDGTRMLNHLRVSLIEQTRVLEGKPIPVGLKPVMVTALVEAGVRYQKSRIAGQRRVIVQGEDVRLLADEMRVATVFMNLVGNALKYSDGEVRITWRPHEDRLLIAVQDQGIAGTGLTREQACGLFVAFARLGAHQEMEGTGLGLLSVQKIAEAHKGLAYVEGRGPEGADFTTGPDNYPRLLEPDFATAFVVSLPLGK